MLGLESVVVPRINFNYIHCVDITYHLTFPLNKIFGMFEDEHSKFKIGKRKYADQNMFCQAIKYLKMFEK